MSTMASPAAISIVGSKPGASDYERLKNESGITREWVDFCKIRRVTDSEAREIVGATDNGNYAGLLFPCFEPGTVRVREHCLRRDMPDIEYKDGKRKEKRKYLFPPGRGNIAIFPPEITVEWLDDKSIPIVLTEGNKKVFALQQSASHGLADEEEKPRFLAVGFSGVWNWRGTIGKEPGPDGGRHNVKGPIPDLDRIKWKGRRVVIAFDTNVLTNTKVSSARWELTQELRRRGAKVSWFSWPTDTPKEINGVDDLLAREGPERILELIEKAQPPITVVEWPQPDDIQSDLPPVESFNLDLLPDSFRPLVEDVAERMQVPPDYPAATMILCLAGAVNRRAAIQPKAVDTSWRVIPNLWGGIVAPPGFMKSPVIQAIAAPLVKIQSEWWDSHQETMADYDRSYEEWDLRRAAWKEQFKAHAKSNKESQGPERPEDPPEKPKLQRLIVNDSTFEALHHTMSENPAGVLVIRDELTGWLSGLEKTGREGERAFSLEAWNGDKSFTMDRVGRGTIHVDASCISMLGGIQPGRLRSYLVDALGDGPDNDGLMQRFQVLVWPDLPKTWELVDCPPNADAEERAAAIFRTLLEASPTDPFYLRFDTAAQQLFYEWLKDLEGKLRSDDLHPALTSHLSKYRSLMPSLAGLFELADRAAGCVSFVSTEPSEFKISLEQTRRAAAWCDYLESHARRIYSCVTTPQMRAARELAAKIRRRKLPGIFSPRHVYRNGWSNLDTSEIVKTAADVLIDAGWLRELKSKPDTGAGRPHGRRYEVNPRVWE